MRNPQGLDESTLAALADLKKQLKQHSKNELIRMVGSLLIEKQMTVALAKQAEEAAKVEDRPVDEFSQELQQKTIEAANV